MAQPAAPNPAVICKACVYLGASLAKKILVEIKPAELPKPILKTDIKARPFSFGILLLDQAEFKTEAAEVPEVIKKQVK
ncbi:unnamed protein product [Ambrosiozyma monospora]|uniref:Unnamed protein product n=1 Tax=Ambrosiozyma monospora TaxID=43982 RepID=A0ACB5UDJ9_AMBMO|nr:unnamed protein product [Ambrosiozyma monospora]